MNITNTFIKNYITSKGITLSFIQQKTGIRYELLRRSINDCTRTLSADEFMLVVIALDLDVNIIKDEIKQQYKAD